MSYSPGTSTVKIGTIVKWTNNDVTPHTATSDDGTSFNTNTISAGSSGTYITNKTGTFPYHCTIHGLSMAGTLIVTN
jgi:plastocyanin